MKIDFLVPGINKCGTTTLCFLLGQHPHIFIPRLKEPHHFSRPTLEDHRAAYERLFRPAKPGQLLGEGSQMYSSAQLADLVSARLKQHNPEMKLIFCVRNPLQRIESSYREFHSRGAAFGVVAPFGLGAAIDALPGLMQDSQYWQRLRSFRDHFPDAQIHIVFLEDLRRAPQAELARCYAFLGVDDAFQNPAADAQLNSRDEKYYDTPLMRFLRSGPLTARQLAKLSIPEQDRIFRPLGLRRPFGAAPLDWPQALRARVIAALKPDVAQLLAHCGKPADYWPEFA
ncbi:MAG: sulfotransferase [Hyphomonadaceae bacterium]|nr:sulfotransferase [Hyphomonadaceae bacterium]